MGPNPTRHKVGGAGKGGLAMVDGRQEINHEGFKKYPAIT